MENIAEELLATPSETPVEPEPAIVAEPDTEQISEAEPETGETEQATPEPKVEPPSTESDVKVPLAALTGERTQRQQAQKELEALRKELADKEKSPRPSVFEDEEGAFNAIRESLREETNNQLLNAGQALAVDKHGQEVVEQSIEWLTQNIGSSPYLAQQFTAVPLLQQHDKAVQLYKQEQARAELENPEELKQRLKDEELKQRLKDEARAELLAEMETKQQEKDKLAQSIPKSLVGSSSRGVLSGSDWSGPTPLENLIGSGG